MYRVYGLTLESDLSFPHLPEWSTRDSGGADLVLRVRPEPPPSGVLTTEEAVPLFERHLMGRLTLGVYESDAGVVFRYPGQVEFHVGSSLREVTCFRYAGWSEELTRWLFLSLVVAFVLGRRGCHNLHAAAVRIGDQAVAFLAPAGGGKSSLAAHFVRAGHALLNDDLLPVVVRDGAAWALPGPPQLRLCLDAALRLRYGGMEASRRPVDGKRLITLPLAERFYCAEPLPLRALYLVEREPARRTGVEPLGQREALVALIASVYANFLSSGPVLSAQLSALTGLVCALPCRRLRIRSGFDELPSVHAVVMDDLARRGPIVRG